MPKTLFEQAEEARLVGKRKLCLKLKNKAEEQVYNELQAKHRAKVEAVKKEFPVDTYIQVINSKVVKIEDGCGTNSGWINITLSGSDKSYTPQELRSKIVKAKNNIRVNAYFDSLRYPKAGPIYIGQYNEAIDDLLDKMSMDRIWGLTEWDEENIDSFSELYSYEYKQAIDEGFTDEEAEEKGREAEDEARHEAYEEYQKKVFQAINYLLRYADLELVKGKKYKYYIAPIKGTSWEGAASKMAEVISGYGTFQYNNGQELKDVGPYKTYSKAVMVHLHWLKHGPEIYGDKSYDYIMQ